MHSWISSKSNLGWGLLMAFSGMFALAGIVTAQNAEAEHGTPGQPHFEVASIKAVAEDSMTQCGDLPCMNLPPRVVDPQRFRAMTVLNGPIGLIEWAYGVRNFQVVEAPDWVSRQKYEVQATTGRPLSEDQIKRMVQTLLEVQIPHACAPGNQRGCAFTGWWLVRKARADDPAKDASINEGRGDIEVRPRATIRSRHNDGHACDDPDGQSGAPGHRQDRAHRTL